MYLDTALPTVGFLEVNWTGSSWFAKAVYIWVQQDNK